MLRFGLLIQKLADVLRARAPADEHNQFVAAEREFSARIVDLLDAYRQAWDLTYEQLFAAMYNDMGAIKHYQANPPTA